MIGKPEWFTYRQFGWGVSPKTWQGWLYVAISAFLLGFGLSSAVISPEMKWLVWILFGVFIFDVMHIMVLLPKVHDERENYHQLLIERNCSFAAIATLIIVALIQSYSDSSILDQIAVPFDSSIMIVLIAMLLTKIATTFYVKRYV